MKNSAYKFWKAIVAVLTVTQWMLPIMIIPGIAAAGFMQETGWHSWWAPAFLGKDGGGVMWCVIVLEATFIIWVLKRHLDIHVVAPLWLKTHECKKLCERFVKRV